MKKKALSFALALVMALGIFSIPAIALEANSTASTVLVNGNNVAFDAYNINDNNYFKLRDVALSVNGTEKQFEVGWDEENNAISLTSGKSYTPNGTEMTGKSSGTKTPTATSSKIFLDGKETSFTAYNIDGSNYFKLRDIGQAFNFGVDWDGEKNTIVIDTSKGYTPDAAPATPPATDVDTSSGDSSGPPIKVSYSAAEVAQIMADNEALIQDEPKNGREITMAELESMLAKYRKSQGSGNTHYTKSMIGDFEKKDGKWKTSQFMYISDNWRRNTDYASKNERLYLKDYSEKAGAVKCDLSLEDTQYYYFYEWYKTATEGTVRKTPKSTTPDTPGDWDGPGDYDPGQMPEMKVMLYPDAKVAGQDCIVYSYTVAGMESYGGMYFWFSKDKGFNILYEMFMSMPSMPDYGDFDFGDFGDFDISSIPGLGGMLSGAQTVSATFTYEDTQVDKNNDFYDPSKQGVTNWVEKTY